ncbi:MAG: N-acetyltransferase family protein [Aquirufa sp.]
MNNIQLRQANINDLTALQAIGRATFLETFAASNSAENMQAYLDEGFSEEKMRTELLNTQSQFYFAEKAGEILGYLKLNGGDAQSEKQDPKALEIERIYVLQVYQGQSVGQMLYEKALVIAQNMQAPYLWLGVWEENMKAIHFYQKQGFKEFGEHIFQLGDDAQRDVLMKLEI